MWYMGRKILWEHLLLVRNCSHFIVDLQVGWLPIICSLLDILLLDKKQGKFTKKKKFSSTTKSVPNIRILQNQS